MENLKMYILIKDSVPTGMALLAAAHASLATYLEFAADDEVCAWIGGPFRKVVCQVSAAEFEAAKSHPDRVILTESALENEEVAIGFRPRSDWPKAFRFYRLYR